MAAAAIVSRSAPDTGSRAEAAPDVAPDLPLAEGPVLTDEPVAAPEPEPAPAPEPIAAAESAPVVDAVTPAAAAVEPVPGPAEEPLAAPAEEPAAPPPTVGPPDLKIRVSTRGLMTAELDGEVEHVMLDDLSPYAEALSHVGGTATIYVPNDEGMPALVGKRAQRILEDAGVRVTLA